MLDKAKREMKARFKSGKFSRQDNTNLTLVYKDRIDHTHNKACHAGLNTDDQGCVYALSSVQTRTCTRKAETAYLKWLMNDSELSEVFLTSLIGDARSNGIVVDGHKPSNLVAIALIATRLPSEWGGRCELWYELHKAGCNGGLALFLVHMFNIFGTSVVRNHASHHLPLPPESSKAILRNYLTGHARMCRTYFECGRYGVLDTTWSDGDHDDNHSYLLDYVSEINIPKARSKNLNIFKVDRKANRWDVDVWCEAVTKASVNLLEEIL